MDFYKEKTKNSFYTLRAAMDFYKEKKTKNSFYTLRAAMDFYKDARQKKSLYLIFFSGLHNFSLKIYDKPLTMDVTSSASNNTSKKLSQAEVKQNRENELRRDINDFKLDVSSIGLATICYTEQTLSECRENNLVISKSETSFPEVNNSGDFYYYAHTHPTFTVDKKSKPFLIVIEMNNDTNKIVGLSMVDTRLPLVFYATLNKYLVTAARLPMDVLSFEEMNVLDLIEPALFKSTANWGACPKKYLGKGLVALASNHFIKYGRVVAQLPHGHIDRVENHTPIPDVVPYLRDMFIKHVHGNTFIIKLQAILNTTTPTSSMSSLSSNHISSSRTFTKPTTKYSAPPPLSLDSSRSSILSSPLPTSVAPFFHNVDDELGEFLGSDHTSSEVPRLDTNSPSYIDAMSRLTPSSNINKTPIISSNFQTQTVTKPSFTNRSSLNSNPPSPQPQPLLQTITSYRNPSLYDESNSPSPTLTHQEIMLYTGGGDHLDEEDTSWIVSLNSNGNPNPCLTSSDSDELKTQTIIQDRHTQEKMKKVMTLNQNQARLKKKNETEKKEMTARHLDETQEFMREYRQQGFNDVQQRRLQLSQQHKEEYERMCEWHRQDEDELEQKGLAEMKRLCDRQMYEADQEIERNFKRRMAVVDSLECLSSTLALTSSSSFKKPRSNNNSPEMSNLFETFELD